jgi:hypothetical protein
MWAGNCAQPLTPRRPTAGRVGDSATTLARSPPMICTAGWRGSGAAVAAHSTAVWNVLAMEAISGMAPTAAVLSCRL